MYILARQDDDVQAKDRVDQRKAARGRHESPKVAPVRAALIYCAMLA
jgi:hypothetical protein